jgi:hypothetical protein
MTAPVRTTPLGTLSASVILVLVAAMVFVLNLGSEGPMIQPDEGSYLANAAAFAGYSSDLVSKYHAGYSMLIAPAFLVAESPSEVWTAVKAINALLFSLAVAGLWLISLQLCQSVSLRDRVGAVAVVSLFPMWVIMTGYSFSQIAFVPAYIFLIFAFLRILSGGISAWLLLGVLAGFLYWIHPTGIIPILATTIAALYVARCRNVYLPPAIFMAITCAMILLYRYGIAPWLHMKMNTSGLGISTGLEVTRHYPGILWVLDPLQSLRGIKLLIAHVAGQIFYLVVGTVGLIGVGVLSLGYGSVAIQPNSDRRTSFEQRAILIATVLPLIGIVGVSALMMSNGLPENHRLDHWMYGRYVEGVIAPVILAGALAQSMRKAIWTVPLALLCALILSEYVVPDAHVAGFNISAFWQRFWMLELGVWGWVASGAMLIIAVVVLPKRLGLALIAAVFVVSNYAQIKWHNDASENASRRWEAAVRIREQYPTGTCVGFDVAELTPYENSVFWVDFGFILFDYDYRRMTLEHWLESCEGPFLSYREVNEESDAPLSRFALSPFNGPTVWIRGEQAGSSTLIAWEGDDSVYSQVGLHTGTGVKTNFKSGFLIHGPYKPLGAGRYRLRMTGHVTTIGKQMFVDVSDLAAKTIHARFGQEEILEGLGEGVILDVEFELAERAEQLEVRVYVDSTSELLISGYSIDAVQ